MYPVDVPAVGPVQADEVRREIEAVCASHSFRHRDSFRKLLTYLAGKTLDGTAESLKEYTVGLELFGKPESYDPREDATVRVQISKLRQKLEEYYLGEGKDDPLMIELPRRQLALVFHSRSPVHDTVPLPSLSAEPAEQHPVKWRVAAGVVAVSAVAFLAGHQFGERPAAAATARAAAPEIEQFWGPLVADGRPIIASLGTPMFIRFRGVRVRAGHEDFEKAKADPRMKQLQALFGPSMQPSHIYTGVGEAAAAFEIARLFTRWNVDVDLRRNSALTWDDISASNIIILGSAKYNPHIRALPVEQSFIVEQAGVANLRPQAGEPPKFLRRYSEDRERAIIEDYAVVSRLPGVNGRGTIIVLGASATEGTAAAVDYVTGAAQLRHLFDRMKDPSGAIPKYFEAVLRVEFRSMVPVATHYQTHREVKQ